MSLHHPKVWSVVLLSGVALAFAACGAPPAPPSPPPLHAVASANSAFRHIQVQKLPTGALLLTGQARVFEAQFSWTLLKGATVLSTGTAQAAAGAPAWSSFQINLGTPTVPAAGLTVRLFEPSAKDGSPTHLLPVQILP